MCQTERRDEFPKRREVPLKVRGRGRPEGVRVSRRTKVRFDAVNDRLQNWDGLATLH
jgi:hypothetical protein